MTGWFRRLGLTVLAAAALGFLDPWQHAREGNRLYEQGKFDEAATSYNQALVDHPDSALLHFNLGDARYREGKYDDALTAFGQVPSGDDDPARTARVAYNVGNTKYRLGEAAEAADPQKALGLWAEALAAYRRALGAAPDDVDAKFNHEFVEKKIAELKQRLEEQRQQQEQQQQQEQDQSQPEEQSQEQDQGQQAPDEDRPQEQQQAGDGPPPQQAAQDEPTPGPQADPNQSTAQPGTAGESAGDGLSRQEAAALLDAQRGDEVRPDEMAKRLQGAVEVEPAQDW
jgi:Ca-activated chloride channel family protein